MGFLDLVFPKRCVGCRRMGAYVCEDCFASLSFDVRVLCVVCNKGSIDGLTHPGCRSKYAIDGVFCSVVYGRVVRKLLYAFKYQPYVSDVGNLMTDLFYEGIIQQEGFVSRLSKTNSVIVPIPLSKARYRKRGYNHAKILADGLGKKLDIAVMDGLKRIRETKPQFGLKREERIQNVRGAFALKKSLKKFPEHMFLIDDVLTSGSTLAEAAHILKHAGAKHVWGVTFAREQDKK